jgi:hypothetical protein
MKRLPTGYSLDSLLKNAVSISAPRLEFESISVGTTWSTFFVMSLIHASPDNHLSHHHVCPLPRTSTFVLEAISTLFSLESVARCRRQIGRLAFLEI